MRSLLPLATAFALLLSGTASAQSPAAAPPLLQQLMKCRSIAEPGARLACFDREAAAFESARQRQEVVVVDREQIRQTRRSLFGLTLPRIPILGGGGGNEEKAAEEQLEGVIRSIRETRDGKWVIGIDDAVWQTTEAEAFQGPPRVGSKVVIRRGPLGSFILAAEGRRGLRAIRIR